MNDQVRFIDVITERDAWNFDGLGGIDLLLVLTINTFSDRDTHSTYASIATLAKRSGVDHRTVRAALARLEKRGLVVVERRNRKASMLTLKIPTTGNFASSDIEGSSASTTDVFGGSTTRKIAPDSPQKRTQTTDKSVTLTKGTEVWKAPDGEEWMNNR